MLPFSYMASGTYTNGSTLVPQLIQLNDKPDWFYVKDLTNWGVQNTASSPVYAEWYSNMASGSYLAMSQPSSTTTGVTLYTSQGTTGGFTFVDSSNPPVFASVVGTTINQTTFVASTSSTSGFNVGDIVRIINPTGMLQLGGYTFAITAINAGVSITLGYMASAVSAGLTLAAGATACLIQKVIPSLFYPRKRNIAYIAAATRTVYFTQPNDFTVGELVDFSIPSSYGMIQLNNLTGQSRGAAKVMSVTNSATVSSITLDIDTTGFTAFTLPTSAAILTPACNSPAVCFPAGSGVVPLVSPPGTNLVDAFDNRNKYYMQIGTSACGIASAKMQWFAFKGDYTS